MRTIAGLVASDIEVVRSCFDTRDPFDLSTSETHKANSKPAFDLKKAAGSAFAAFTIGSTILNSPIANAVETQPFAFSSSNIVAEKVIRQGLYQDYEVDLVQERDDARSTFKSAGETKSKKGEYLIPR